MAVLTTLAQLEEVQTAITTILTSGQDVTIGERRYKRADLKALQDREATLKAQYYTEQNGPVRNFARFDNPQ
jgi:hypothetical protein